MPWIVASGEILPSIFDDAHNHLVWATTNPDGDPTVNLLRGPDFFLDAKKDWSEKYQLLAVRFTLPAAGFIRWDTVKKTLSRKVRAEQDKQDDYERKLYGAATIEAWRVRRTAVPLKSVLRVDVGRPGHWSRIKLSRKYCHDISDDPPTMAYEIDGFLFYSMLFMPRVFMVPERDELAEMYEESQWKG